MLGRMDRLEVIASQSERFAEVLADTDPALPLPDVSRLVVPPTCSGT